MILNKYFPDLKDFRKTIIIGLVGFLPLLLVATFQASADLSRLILWLVGIGLLLVLSKPKQLTFTKNYWFLGLTATLLLFGLLGTLLSLDWRNSIFGTHPRFQESFLFMATWLVFVYIINSQKVEFIQRLLRVSMYVAILAAMLAIVQVFGIAFYDGLIESARVIVPSFMGNPNFTAMYIVAVIPFFLEYNFKLENNYAKIVYWGLFTLCLIALCVFGSRGAYVALALSMVVYFSLQLWRKKISWSNLAIVGTIFAVGVLVASQFFAVGRLDSVSTDQELIAVSDLGRVIVWEQAAEYITSSPLRGTGFGNFFLAFRQNNHPYITEKGQFDDAHNLFIQNFVTNGAVYGLAFILFVLCTLIVLYKYYLSKKSEYQGTVIALIAGIVAWCVAASFTPIPIPNWILFGLLIGGAWKISLSHQVATPPLKSTAVLKLIGVLLIMVAVFMIIGNIYANQSHYAELRGQYEKQLQHAETSLSVFPFIPRADSLRVNAAIDLGQYDVAEQYIAESLEKHPLSAGIYQDATLFYIRLYKNTDDQYYKEQGLKVLERAVALNSNNFSVQQISSLYYLYLDEPERALVANTKSLVLGLDNFNNWILRSKLYYDLRNEMAAKNSAKAASAIGPNRNIRIFINQLEAGKTTEELDFPYVF